MITLLIATLFTAITIGFGVLGSIELDSYEKINGKPHKFDVPLMLLICFAPFIVFIGTIYLSGVFQI